MKNTILRGLLGIALLATSILEAQDFQGLAVYQTKTKLTIDFASSGMPADRVKHMEERMKSELEKTFELTFNKSESIYKEEEKLDQSPNGSRGGGMRFMMMNGGATGGFYKNTQTKTSTKENEFSGKNFLVKGNLKTYDWKLEQETKMIGEKLCFKATTVIEIPVKPDFKFGRRDAKEEEKEAKEEVLKMEQLIATAWYSLDIPVNHGPGDFWGLPGLILQISYGDTTIMCTKIVINPKGKNTISEPTKGKVVTQEEYDVIVTEKMKEMRERFQNEREKSGNDAHFRMRG